MNHARPARAATPVAADTHLDPVWDVTLLMDARIVMAPQDGDTERRPWATDYDEIE